MALCRVLLHCSVLAGYTLFLEIYIYIYMNQFFHVETIVYGPFFLILGTDVVDIIVHVLQNLGVYYIIIRAARYNDI